MIKQGRCRHCSSLGKLVNVKIEKQKVTEQTNGIKFIWVCQGCYGRFETVEHYQEIIQR